MIPRRDLHIDARIVRRVELHDGRIVTVFVPPSARYAFLEVHGLGLFALDATDLKELLVGLHDAARTLDEGDDA